MPVTGQGHWWHWIVWEAAADSGSISNQQTGHFYGNQERAFVRLSSGTAMERRKTSSFQIFFFSDQFSYPQGGMASTAIFSF